MEESSFKRKRNKEAAYFLSDIQDGDFFFKPPLNTFKINVFFVLYMN